MNHMAYYGRTSAWEPRPYTGTIPGCSSPPVISTSRRNRPRLTGSSAETALNLLQRHLAMQLLIERDEDGPDSPHLVRS